MDIKKSKTLDSGVEVTYWRVGAISIDLLNSKMTVICLGYLNEDAYKNGKTSILNEATDLALVDQDLIAKLTEIVIEKMG